jgi:hypothetical protein
MLLKLLHNEKNNDAPQVCFFCHLRRRSLRPSIQAESLDMAAQHIMLRRIQQSGAASISYAFRSDALKAAGGRQTAGDSD